MAETGQLKHEDPQALERELHTLEGRDLQLWCLIGLIAVILAAGFLAVMMPRLVSQLGTSVLAQQNLPVLVGGLLILLLLLAVYMVQQRIRLMRTRRNLTGRLLQAERASRIDELTGLWNRRNLEELLPREMARAQRTGTRLSVVMVDVDNFSTLDTRFGHVVAERVLLDVSRMLKRNFRAADILLRYSEHEFLTILPETDRGEAQIAVDRLQGAVGVGQWNRRNQEFGYTLGLSAGIAQFVPDASTLESLIEAADAEIYNSRQERARHTQPVSQ